VQSWRSQEQEIQFACIAAALSMLSTHTPKYVYTGSI